MLALSTTWAHNDAQRLALLPAIDRNAIPEVDRTRWRIDPTRSSVEFHAPNFWGLATVKGRFERYDGTLDLSKTPAIELTIEAASLDTNNKKRDTYLRSGDFFDAANHHHLGMAWNRLGMLRTPSKLIVHGRLVQDGN